MALTTTHTVIANELAISSALSHSILTHLQCLVTRVTSKSNICKGSFELLKLFSSYEINPMVPRLCKSKILTVVIKCGYDF